MKYVSGRIVRGIYIWLGWSGEVADPIGSSVPVRANYFLLALPLPRSNPIGINTPHNPATDILHSPAYEDGTYSEFRNVGS